MKRRGLFKGLLAGGVAGGTALAARAVAPVAPAVIEKTVEVIHEVRVPAPPEKLTRAEIIAFISGPFEMEQVDVLAQDEPKIVHLDTPQDVMWNGIGFHLPAGDPLVPGPIAYVLIQSREDALASQIAWLRNTFSNG